MKLTQFPRWCGWLSALVLVTTVVAPRPAEQEDVHTFSGVITHMRLMLRRQGDEPEAQTWIYVAQRARGVPVEQSGETFVLPVTVVVTRDGKRASLGDLAIGTYVYVYYTDAGKYHKATKVVIPKVILGQNDR